MQDLMQVLETHLPNITTVTTAQLHKPPTTVKQTFVRSVGVGGKAGLFSVCFAFGALMDCTTRADDLLRILKGSQRRKTIVFCNKVRNYRAST